MNRYVRHQIIRGSSRALSLVVIACALWRAWPVGTALWYVVLIMGPGMVFIWFPEQVDEYLFGTWVYGYRIDAHTPPVLIAAMGWLLLLVDASLLFSPEFLGRLFGM